MRVLPSLFLAALLFPTVGFAQSNMRDSKIHPVVSMPIDRAVDSYQIYSSLIPVGQTADKHWPHSFYVVRETTVPVVPEGQPCWEPRTGADNDYNWSGNPHLAVHPPADRAQDFQEILNDFDAHCHQRVRLMAGAFSTPAPVRILSPEEQDEFRAALLPGSTAMEKYRGAPALYSFSQVYFNNRHTVALVYASQSCGSLCGEGAWHAFALEGGHWKALHWRTDGWTSDILLARGGE